MCLVLSGNDKGISWCRIVTPAVKGEMAQVLQDATDKKTGASKRFSDTAAITTGLAISTAAVAVSKRPRASLSSGPVVGPGGIAAAFARRGDISADAKATMALAGMIHSEGLSGDFAQKRKVVAALEASKVTSTNYKTPGRQQVDGPLLDALAGQYDAYAFDQIAQLKEDYGLACVSDGATVHHSSLINVLAILLTIVVLLASGTTPRQRNWPSTPRAGASRTTSRKLMKASSRTGRRNTGPHSSPSTRASASTTRTLERAPTTAFGPTCSHGRARGAVAGWPPATRCHRATPPRTPSRT